MAPGSMELSESIGTGVVPSPVNGSRLIWTKCGFSCLVSQLSLYFYLIITGFDVDASCHAQDNEEILREHRHRNNGTGDKWRLP